MAWSFYALAALAVAFRFLARLILLPGKGGNFWWDDWMMLFTFVLLTVYQALLATSKSPSVEAYNDVQR